MVCMMSKEQVAIFALLVTLTWACQLPEQCNLAGVPALNATDLQGNYDIDQNRAHEVEEWNPDLFRYLVMLGQHMIGQFNFTYIGIAVRDPATAATVIAENQVLEKISTLCGNTVTSPNYFITIDSSSLRTC
ncbi:hypothetical protein ACOMHN_056797 [Nucella lapillus]